MGPGSDIFGTRIRILGPGSDIVGSKNMKFGPKWVHMARYELILRLVRALWLRILLKALLTLNSAVE